MNSFIILQTSQNVLEKSAELAQKDPHGAIITLVSVSVVFLALVILFFAYTFIGRVASGELSFRKKASKKNGPSEEEAAAIAMALEEEFGTETYAAIGMALHQYLNDTVHDMESYIITIKRRK